MIPCKPTCAWSIGLPYCKKAEIGLSAWNCFTFYVHVNWSRTLCRWYSSVLISMIREHPVNISAPLGTVGHCLTNISSDGVFMFTWKIMSHSRNPHKQNPVLSSIISNDDKFVHWADRLPKNLFRKWLRSKSPVVSWQSLSGCFKAEFKYLQIHYLLAEIHHVFSSTSLNYYFGQLFTT